MTQMHDLITKDRLQQYCKNVILPDGEALYYDYSRTLPTDSSKQDIINILKDRKLLETIQGMRKGEKINFTENKKVLHHLLRSNMPSQKFQEDISLQNEQALILNERAKLKLFDQEFDSLIGATGKPLTTILNIGIGGSDLGPRLALDALSPFKKRNVYFISSIDPSGLLRLSIDYERTLVVVVSKSFTTEETIENAKLVLIKMKQEMFSKNLLSDENSSNIDSLLIQKHFVAVSAEEYPKINNIQVRTFKMWDFVGGRYSIWSAAGLSIVLGLGYLNYEKMLGGAYECDCLFFNDPIDSPSCLMAINDIHHQNLKNNFNNKCIVAYDNYLQLFYKYIQQLQMESNGKQNSNTQIIWGGLGTDAQHSFFQMLHQNDMQIFLEMLLPANNIFFKNANSNNNKSLNKNNEVFENELNTLLKDKTIANHRILISNCLAQAKALMDGTDDRQQSSVRYCKGNKPTSIILYSSLTPSVLGFLIATYEHKVLIEGIFYQINSFDQFGVELGKKLTKCIFDDSDLVTSTLLEKINKMNK